MNIFTLKSEPLDLLNKFDCKTSRVHFFVFIGGKRREICKMIKYAIYIWKIFLPRLWVGSLGILAAQEKKIDSFCIASYILTEPKKVKRKWIRKKEGKLLGRLLTSCAPPKTSNQMPPWLKPIICLIEDKAYFYYWRMKGVEKISLKKAPILLFLHFLMWPMLSKHVIHTGEENGCIWGKKIISRLRSLMNEERKLKERRETGESSIPVSDLKLWFWMRPWKHRCILETCSPVLISCRITLISGPGHWCSG